MVSLLKFPEPLREVNPDSPEYEERLQAERFETGDSVRYERFRRKQKHIAVFWIAVAVVAILLAFWRG